jgi:hypothetical protein
MMHTRMLATAMLLAALSSAGAFGQNISGVDRSREVPIAGIVKYIRYDARSFYMQLLVIDPTGKVREWEIDGDPLKALISESRAPGRVLFKPIKQWDKLSLRIHPKLGNVPGGEIIAASRVAN